MHPDMLFPQDTDKESKEITREKCPLLLRNQKLENGSWINPKETGKDTNSIVS